MSNENRIVLLSNNVNADYVERIYSGTQSVDSASRFTMESENLFDTSRDFSEIIENPKLAGVILTPPLCDDRHLLSQIEMRSIPMVRIAPLLDLDRGVCVTLDEYDAARQVTDHLLDKGHVRIGIMRGPKEHLVSMRRYNGYVFALGKKRISVDSDLVVQGDFSRRSGQENAHRLFAGKPTAIFACNDDMAVGILDAAKALNIGVPDEVSLVGYDDNAIATQVSPKLTSVRQPLEKMGELASKMMISRIEEPERTVENIVLPLELVERDSVKAVTTGGM